MGPPSWNQHVRNSLLRGRFIVLATMLAGLIWAEALTSVFVYWTSPALNWLTVVAYLLTYGALIGLLLDNHAVTESQWTKVLWSAIAFGGAVLGELQLAAHCDATLVDPAQQSGLHPLVFAVSALGSVASHCIDWLGPHAWIAAGTLLVALGASWCTWWILRRPKGQRFSVSNRAYRSGLRGFSAILIAISLLTAGSWLARHIELDRLLKGTWLPLAIVVIAAAFVGSIWAARSFFRRRSVYGVAPSAGMSGQALDRCGPSRLTVAKVCITIVFSFFTSLVLVFTIFLVGMINAKDHSQILFMAIALLSVLNWAAFSTRGWKDRVSLGAMAAAVMFFMIPVSAQDPMLFPRMLVTTLGFGNRHASSMALSGQQCAMLAPFGIRCAAEKDSSITLTHVNIVNRLGSSMAIELLLRVRPQATGMVNGPTAAKTDPNGTKPMRSGKLRRGETPASMAVVTTLVDKGNSIASVQTLVLTPSIADAVSRQRQVGCDQRLLDQLQRVVEKTARSDDRAVTQRAEQAVGASTIIASNTVDTSGATDSGVIVSGDNLACVRVTIPKDQIISYTSAGERTYRDGYSGYIPAVEKASSPH
ncbi:hypothetical protein BX604_3064 [Burkholderia sp. JKS000303]|nr:hypothetical protein BX604_3064 [Burkholderia sp. JKS000303]